MAKSAISNSNNMQYNIQKGERQKDKEYYTKQNTNDWETSNPLKRGGGGWTQLFWKGKELIIY